MLFLFLTLAAVWDISLHRVPNWLLLAGWLVGFGFSPGVDYLGRSVLPVIVLYPFWFRRMLGGADVKLLGVLCGWIGLWPGFLCFFYSLLFAGGIGLCRLLLHRSILVRFSYFFQYLRSSAAWRGAPFEGPARWTAEFPLAAALWVGVLVHQILP